MELDDELADIKPKEDASSLASPGRRRFIGSAVVSIASVAAISHLATKDAPAEQITPKEAGAAASGHKRRNQVYQIRVDAARSEKNRPVAEHPTNGDEDLYPNKIGNYSKGLPHNSLGEVDVRAYDSLIRALSTGTPADFEDVVIGGSVKLTNPQAGLAFDMQGPDSHSLSIRPAPAFSSAEEAAEIAENYWMALNRDVSFSEYESNPLTTNAADDLSRFSDFRGPKSAGRVTPATLFRGTTPGDLSGPYVSQFMWKETPFGAERIDRRMQTAAAGVDYMTSYADWLAIQNGAPPAATNQFDSTPRYIRNGRDLGQWVHI